MQSWLQGKKLVYLCTCCLKCTFTWSNTVHTFFHFWTINIECIKHKKFIKNAFKSLLHVNICSLCFYTFYKSYTFLNIVRKGDGCKETGLRYFIFFCELHEHKEGKMKEKTIPSRKSPLSNHVSDIGCFLL